MKRTFADKVGRFDKLKQIQKSNLDNKNDVRLIRAKWFCLAWNLPLELLSKKVYDKEGLVYFNELADEIKKKQSLEDSKKEVIVTNKPNKWNLFKKIFG